MTTQEINSLYEELESILVRRFPPEEYGEDDELASICTIAQELRDELQKQKELNAELVLVAKAYLTKVYNEKIRKDIESLIKKSKES